MCHFPPRTELYTRTVKDPNKSCALRFSHCHHIPASHLAPAPPVKRGFCSCMILEHALAYYPLGGPGMSRFATPFCEVVFPIHLSQDQLFKFHYRARYYSKTQDRDLSATYSDLSAVFPQSPSPFLSGCHHPQKGLDGLQLWEHSKEPITPAHDASQEATVLPVSVYSPAPPHLSCSGRGCRGPATAPRLGEAARAARGGL